MSGKLVAVIAFSLVAHAVVSSAERPASFAADPSVPTDSAPTEEQLKAVSSDWLFHVRTTSCSGTSFDNNAHSLFSRTLLPLLFVSCALAIFAFGSTADQTRAEAEKLILGSEAYETFGTWQESHRQLDQSPEPSKNDAPIPPESKARLWHLDFARICAIMCVIFEHCGGEDYTHRNVAFGLWWALPYLYMTSGIGCMMSKKSMIGYVGRLLCVFAAGVGANWTADVIRQRDWQHDFGNTVFQMFFVVMLVIMAILTEPLRLALQRRRDHEMLVKPTNTTLVAMSFWGLVTFASLFFFVRSSSSSNGRSFSNSWMQFYAPIFQHIPLIVILVGGTLFLSTYAAVMVKPEKTGLVGWLLLAYIYVPSVMVPWDQSGFFHLMTLYIFAMVTTVFPLMGTDTIAKWVRSYWPFLLMILCLVSMPDMWGRCDVHPPYATWERFRLMLGEFIMTVCFVTSAFAPDDPYNVTAWMGWWSLYAYCFHVMWFRLLGSPYGAIVTFSFIGVFYMLHVKFGTKEDKKQKSANEAQCCQAAQHVLAP